MTTTIGSLDLNAFSDLHSDLTQYFWFEPNASATHGAGAHVTLVPDASFISNPTGQNILMNTDGFSIRNGLLPMMTLDNNSLNFNVVDTTAGTYTTTATFTSTSAQIGQNGESHLEMDNNGMCLVDRDDTKYFEVSDLRDGDGFLVNRFVGDGQKSTFTLSSIAIEPSSADNTAVTVDGIPQTFGMYTSDHWYVVSTFGYYSVVQFPYDSPPADGAVIVVKYMSSENTTAFTFGTRKQEAPVGGLSSVFGDNCEARTPYTFAQGKGTVAIFNNQAVFGRYNDPDEEGDYGFVIGNGKANDARSNALTVDWKGNVEASGSIVTDSNFNQAYSVTVSSLAGSTYLGQAIDLGEVGLKHPIFNGFDISGTGTARIHTLGHYLYKENGHWKACIKMRNDNTSAINGFTVKAYITWI